MTSILAALVSFGLWCVLAIGIFGSARALARHDFWLLGSALIPLVAAGAGGFFAYRHTARRRKLQCTITVVLTVIIVILVYAVGNTLAHDRFYIPRTWGVRHDVVSYLVLVQKLTDAP